MEGELNDCYSEHELALVRGIHANKTQRDEVAGWTSFLFQRCLIPLSACVSIHSHSTSSFELCSSVFFCSIRFVAGQRDDHGHTQPLLEASRAGLSTESGARQTVVEGLHLAGKTHSTFLLVLVVVMPLLLVASCY